jgi:hypothetical protein
MSPRINLYFAVLSAFVKFVDPNFTPIVAIFNFQKNNKIEIILGYKSLGH